VQTRRERIRAIEDRIYGFYRHHQSRFLPILALEACFHLAGVAEVYATLYLMNARPTWLAAFVLESVNRVINVVFKFVPMRAGVDEFGTGKFTKLLKVGTEGIGVTLAIIRKARVIFWTAVGVGVLVRRGLSVRTMAREAAAIAATQTGLDAQHEAATTKTDEGDSAGENDASGNAVADEEELTVRR